MTPQQTNTWPTKTSPVTLSGERVNVEYAADSPNKILLQIALERFNQANNFENNRRAEMEQDQRFAAGVQWDQTIQNQRRSQGRPCLTINRIAEFLAHAVNNMRQSRPAIKIDPVGDGADEDSARIRQGIIRHIENNSRADIPYDVGFENMCKMGLGWLRIVDDWAAPDSFEKELYIRWVPNPFLVFSDPDCSQPDWSDMRWAFVIEDLTRSEFKARFPKADMVSLESYIGRGANRDKQWFPGGKIRVAEYFHVEWDDRTIVEFDDNPGDVKDFDDVVPPAGKQYLREEDDLYQIDDEDEGYDQGELKHVGRVRDTKLPVVHWDMISGVEILKRRIWKGKYIPLIPVIGNQTDLEGEKIIVGMVRYAREPQRMYNYMYTSFVETVALAPKAPFIAEIDQIPDGLVEEWSKANQNPTSLLRYKAKVVEGGGLLPPPQRQQAEPPIAAFVQGLQICDQNLKATFRIYDASLGQKGPQESGLAINARKIESDTGIYNWGDNFIRSLRMVGIQLNDLLPYYYNTPGKVIRILQDDLTTQEVTINKDFTVAGITKFYDLSQGRYQVVVSTGPTAQTKRQEAATNMTELVKVYPALMQVAGDLIVREMDFIGKDAIAARLRQALPPALQPPEENDPISPQAKQALDQQNQLIQSLTAALHEATDKKELQLLKESFETLRTQMIQERQLASDSLKVGSQEAQFLSQKIFDELNNIRAMYQPVAQAAVAHSIIEAGGDPALAGLPAPVTPGLPGAPPAPQVSATPAAPAG